MNTNLIESIESMCNESEQNAAAILAKIEFRTCRMKSHR